MIVETQFVSFPECVVLDSGKSLSNITVAYETYGVLNDTKDNAILLIHALTGDAHAAGYHVGDKKPGWWDDMVGSGKAFDTDKYFVISSNILGGCKGTTGPASINPETQKPYGLSFPVVTLSDAVKVQKRLIDYLGVKKLCVAGGSMGGMQALEWSIRYAGMVSHCIVIAATSRLSPQGIAFNTVGRNAIISDPNWNFGDYYDKDRPEKGLSIARMVGHITYLCEEAMLEKFSRRFQHKQAPDFHFDIDFEVEGYLAHQGQIFVDRFDANSYLYITKAMDYFDLVREYGTLQEAFKDVQAKYLIVSFSSDWLFPTSHSKEIVTALMKNRKNVSFCEIQSSKGHDAFLLEYEAQTKMVKSFLREETRE